MATSEDLYGSANGDRWDLGSCRLTVQAELFRRSLLKAPSTSVSVSTAQTTATCHLEGPPGDRLAQFRKGRVSFLRLDADDGAKAAFRKCERSGILLR